MASTQGRKPPGAPPHAHVPRSSSIDDETIAFWQRRTTRTLREKDARQIITNAAAFFTILREWQSREERAGSPKQPDTRYS